MDQYQQTIDAFDKQADAYQNFFKDVHLYDDTYDAFCELVKPDARILELGCGPGNITKYVLTKRPDLNVEATDGAPAMVVLAQENNPAANCHVLEVRDLEKITQPYDGVICGFCMPYLSKEDCRKLIADCAALLTAGGIFYFSTIEGPYSRSGWEASSNGKYKAFVYYHQEDYLTQYLADTKFELVEVFRKPYPKANGVTDTHLVFIARKK